jgi:hypothetical protein
VVSDISEGGANFEYLRCNRLYDGDAEYAQVLKVSSKLAEGGVRDIRGGRQLITRRY